MRIRTHIAALAGALVAATALIPAHAELPEKSKVTICHATGNPGHWVKQNVAVDAIFRSNGHAYHQDGRDIIPPFNPVGDLPDFPGLNWDDEHRAIWKNGCVVPAAPTPTPTPSETPDPTPEPSDSPTPSESPTPEPTTTVTVTAPPDPQPTVTATATATATETVTASPDPQPTVTTTATATATATEQVPGPTVTATVTPDGSVHPSPPTTTRPAPSTDHEQVVASAYPTRPGDVCELGDPYESRMCESATQFPLPVEESTSTVAAVPAQVPGLPKAGW